MRVNTLIMNNQYGFYNYIGQGKLHDSHKSRKFSWIRYKGQYSDLSFYPGDYIYNITTQNESDIEEIINKIIYKEIPCAVWIEEVAENIEMIKALDENDFALSFMSAAMHLKIDEMKSFDVKDKDNKIQIKLVDNDELLKQWVNILIDSWWIWCKGSEMSLYSLYEDIYKNHDKIRLYIALYDGKPAGTSLCYLDNNSVGLYLISTHPDYRGKGIGKLLTKAPIIDAQKDGYQDAVLHGTEMGEVIYRQLGFKEYFLTRSYYLPLEKMK